jgi:hypothetical protein
MHGRERPLLVTRFALTWRGCSRRCCPEIGYELMCASGVRRRGWTSGPARDESTDRFHAIDSRPVWWTGAEPGDWSSARSVDRDCASGLVSSLVISVVVKLTFSLRRHRVDLTRLEHRVNEVQVAAVKPPWWQPTPGYTCG